MSPDMSPLWGHTNNLTGAPDVCADLKAKMHQIRLRLGSAPDRWGSLQRSPSIVGLKAAYFGSKWKEGEVMEGRERKGREENEEKEGKEIGIGLQNF